MKRQALLSIRKAQIAVHAYGSPGPTVLVMAGVHGDEPAGVQVAREFEKLLQTLPASSLTNRVVMMPLVNPDGYSRRTRTNAHGIDVNRNFPTKDFGQGGKDRYYGGEIASSEPETRSVEQVVAQYRPWLIISLHAPMQCVNYDGPAKQESEQLANLCGLPVKKDIGYQTPGSMGRYYGVERGLKVVTLELPGRVTRSGRYCSALAHVVGVTVPRGVNTSGVPVRRIVVSTQQNLLLAYSDTGRLVRAYRVCTGRTNCTPVGSFRVVGKSWLPSGTPLGTRWMPIDRRNRRTGRQYGIHGTDDPGSVGRQESRGCIRLANQDVERLYEVTPVGATVTIVDDRIAPSTWLEQIGTPDITRAFGSAPGLSAVIPGGSRGDRGCCDG
jgi:protein MpaA